VVVAPLPIRYPARLPAAAAAGESLVVTPFPINSALLLPQKSKPPSEPIASPEVVAAAAAVARRCAIPGRRRSAQRASLVALDSAPRSNVNGS
jgi:hypothetical protein